MRHIQAPNHYALQQPMLQGMVLGMPAATGMCGIDAWLESNAYACLSDPVGGPAEHG